VPTITDGNVQKVLVDDLKASKQIPTESE